MKRNHPRIEIMDTTLRDGEQTSGVSFVPHEKLMIARLLLEDLKVDRVEVASARVSDGEFDAVKMICDWAARRSLLSKVEVLGFVDGHTSVDWIHATGCRVINLLCKGSLKHCTFQLRKTPEEHIENILAVVDYANESGLEVNVYLEDWSNGMKDSPEYVFQLVDALINSEIKRYMLPDTLGILNPLQVIEYMRKMLKRYPHVHFDFHAHNDYDLAVSNVLAAVLSGAKGLHTTINGLGERAGNAPLASVQAILHDHFAAKTNIDESRLNEVSRVVESYSGIMIPANKPIVGENVFTQVAGVHADGDNKSNLYCNDLLPERFGRKREYALGKNSGKANIRKNLEDLGLDLDEQSMRKVTERIIELGDKKELVTQEDLPYIVSDVLKHSVMNERVNLKSYIVNLAYGLKPMATLKIEINGKEYEASSSGDGQYDAFVRALRKVYKTSLGRKFPMLTNYAVSIPPGGRTDAFVQTVITWNFEDKVFRTRGLDADQTEAAIKATVKMLNIIESTYEQEKE
jgi:Isopropylmalate/homocitrate/citramalate synthases